MPQANRRTTTLTMLDAIAPNRTRFTVITNPAPSRNATMALIDRLAGNLAAKGSPIPDLSKEPPLPGITQYGKITDQPAYTAAVLARLAARNGGDQ